MRRRGVHVDLRSAQRRGRPRPVSPEGTGSDDADASRAPGAVPRRQLDRPRHRRWDRHHRPGAAPDRDRPRRPRGWVDGVAGRRPGGGSATRPRRPDRVRRGRLRAAGRRHRTGGHRDPRPGRLLLPRRRRARRPVGRAGPDGVRTRPAARPVRGPDRDPPREPLVPAAAEGISRLRPPDGTGRRDRRGERAPPGRGAPTLRRSGESWSTTASAAVRLLRGAR